MREVHDFLAELIRRGQEQGSIAAERDADAEAWIMLAGGILGMVGRRVGLLDDGELEAIRAARLGSAADAGGEYAAPADAAKRPQGAGASNRTSGPANHAFRARAVLLSGARGASPE